MIFEIASVLWILVAFLLIVYLLNGKSPADPEN